VKRARDYRSPSTNTSYRRQVDRHRPAVDSVRRLASVLLLIVGTAAVPRIARAQPKDTLPVTVRIHDYAGAPRASIASAQEYVTDLYANIGVQTLWLEPLRQSTSPMVDPQCDREEIVINMITREASHRLGVPDNALGLAAVSLLEGGKVAYLLFDPISDVALTSGIRLADILGIVIAHELGHLLLPYGSHSPSGLMRSIWRPQDFGGTFERRLAFTSAQSARIRALLRRWKDDTSLPRRAPSNSPANEQLNLLP
jgi:hypothetical protein